MLVRPLRGRAEEGCPVFRRLRLRLFTFGPFEAAGRVTLQIQFTTKEKNRWLALHEK